MISEIFDSLHKELLKHKNIEVDISLELAIWNSLTHKDSQTIDDFFGEFIFSYGMFHELLEKSNALGDKHEIILSLINENILMEGITYPKEKSFRWIFDKKGTNLQW